MIIRILGEGQFDLPDADLAELNALDAALESALNSTGAGVFAAALDALLDFVRVRGATLEPTTIVASDVVLPPADATEEEVRDMLTDEGLVPD